MEGCISEKNLSVKIQKNCSRKVFGKNFVDAISAGKEDTVAAIENSVESSSSALEEKIKNRKASPEKKPPKQRATIKADKATYTSRSVQINMPVSQPKQVSPKSPALQPEITEIDVWRNKRFVHFTILPFFFFRNKFYLVLCTLLKLNIQKSKLIVISPAVHFASIQLFVVH